MRDVLVKWPQAAGDIAPWRFDLNHIGAQVAEQLTTE
jgi:hypothetical protein